MIKSFVCTKLTATSILIISRFNINLQVTLSLSLVRNSTLFNYSILHLKLIIRILYSGVMILGIKVVVAKHL